MQDMYHKYFEDFKLDETCRSSGRQMTEADTRISIGVIGGSHPLHIDPEYCASRPDVGRPIVQGSMVLGFIDAGMYDALCPGGEVVAAASATGRVVTNGMSEFARNKEHINGALLVNVTPEDFGAEGGPLAGIAFQRRL